MAFALVCACRPLSTESSGKVFMSKSERTQWGFRAGYGCRWAQLSKQPGVYLARRDYGDCDREQPDSKTKRYDRQLRYVLFHKKNMKKTNLMMIKDYRSSRAGLYSNPHCFLPSHIIIAQRCGRRSVRTRLLVSPDDRVRPQPTCPSSARSASLST
jgi:hypothetical protein